MALKSEKCKRDQNCLREGRNLIIFKLHNIFLMGAEGQFTFRIYKVLCLRHFALNPTILSCILSYIPGPVDSRLLSSTFRLFLTTHHLFSLGIVLTYRVLSRIFICLTVLPCPLSKLVSLYMYIHMHVFMSYFSAVSPLCLRKGFLVENWPETCLGRMAKHGNLWSERSCLIIYHICTCKKCFFVFIIIFQ